jgi:hypothetical protein
LDLITEYIRLGLALGRHIDGFVDAYYGPPELSEEASAAGPMAPAALVADARRLLAALDGDGEIEAGRRNWIKAQARGLLTTARKLAGESISYLDEIADSYGVRPSLRDEEDFAAAHRRLDAVLPAAAGSTLADRYRGWTEAQAVPPERLEEAVNSLADDFRQRTRRQFGLPDGEHVDFVFETGKPWSGFNYYLGGLRSRVALNVDLPVLSTGLGHLVAHEAYPGHHTEHTRKEVGLVRRRLQMEESIFVVGTPQCLVAEGLADLGLEMIAGRGPEQVIAEHLAPLGIPYDAGVVAEVRTAAESIGAVRGNAAIGLHDRGWSVEDAVSYVERWSLVSRPRAERAVRFLTDPTWRAYCFCYIDGLRLCRQFVDGDASRFERLISDQLVPAQLEAAAPAP